MKEEQINHIVRVLTFQGNASTSSDDIFDDLIKIRDRYTELKRDHSFYEASILARAEWLESYIEPFFP